MDLRPNIVLFIAYVGAAGSENRTLKIDARAPDGVLNTAMHDCSRCGPNIASLLTGLYPHHSGVGHMGADLGTPAYRTLMSGKSRSMGDFTTREVDSWCVGDVDHLTPIQRGFDRFYGIVNGIPYFLSPHFMLQGDGRVQVLPDNCCFTGAISNKAILIVEG